MTSDSKLFSTYLPSAGNEKINTRNGSSSLIVGIGSITITKFMKLDSVRHVPYLACNLLSISKLTKQANCWAHFCFTHCIFQDLSLEKMIGNAKEHDGLYYLYESMVRNLWSQIQCNLTTTSKNKDANNLLLWHRRRGYPNIQYLSQLFPEFCFNKEPFHCNKCELAKNHRAIFKTVEYKPTSLFSIIHSDLWGPACVLNCTHTKWFLTFIDDYT